MSGAEIQTLGVDTRIAAWISTAEKLFWEKLRQFLNGLGWWSERQLCIKAWPFSGHVWHVLVMFRHFGMVPSLLAMQRFACYNANQKKKLIIQAHTF